MSRRPRLLVVEDDPAILSLFVAYLEKDGYQVAGAATAASAEALVKQQEFDLILLDLGLPDEDGVLVARMIPSSSTILFFFIAPPATDTYTLSLHDAPPSAHVGARRSAQAAPPP